ncbi:MAG: NRDE family protein [Pseudomonadota bacterium]
MCLIAFAIGASATRPLVIAANRDEFFDRPALPLAKWQAAGGPVISGRDLRAGGTWLGASPQGRIAMLTNVREPNPQAAPRSRGDLPLQWLARSDMAAQDFLQGLDAQHFGGCNLVLGDVSRGQWTWATNRPDAATLASAGARSNSQGWFSQFLSPGLYGLSNALLDTPWPKTLALKSALQQALAHKDESDMVASLWPALMNPRRAEAHELPETGVSPALEMGLSSAFVDMPERGYGTRCSTVLCLSHAKTGLAGNAWERSVGEPGEARVSWLVAA